jgi:hypothetical protein
VGEHLINAGDRKDAQHGVSGDHQQDAAAFRLRPPVRADQRMKAGRVAEPGPAHVDHHNSAPARRGIEQRRPQPGGIGDVDLFGRDNDGDTPDHLDREPDLIHDRSG